MNEQWPQELIDRMIRSLSERMYILTMVVHARDYLRDVEGLTDYCSRCNAIEILGDGLKNLLDKDATGLEWWTLRHRLTNEEIQSGSWLDTYATSWITAREAEEKRNGKQR